MRPDWIGLSDTGGPFQPQLLSGFVLLPDLFDGYTHTNEKCTNLWWHIILLIAPFSDSRCPSRNLEYICELMLIP